MKFFKILIVLALFLAISGCSVEIRNPQETSGNEIFLPESSVPEEPQEPPLSEASNPAEEKHEFMSFEDITAAGYYPLYMQPHTHIIYDENCVPTIIQGGVITEEDTSGRDEFEELGYLCEYTIEPNTKAEYDLWGCIQNICFLWPDGSYNLSPFEGWETVDWHN